MSVSVGLAHPTAAEHTPAVLIELATVAAVAILGRDDDC